MVERHGRTPPVWRRQVVEGFNDNRREFDLSRTVVHLVAERAAEHPWAKAVVDERVSLTYGELERQSDSVARGLLSRGVRRGDLVVICVEPSADWVVGALAILKARAAYVPIDPEYPMDRIGLILDDTAARTIIGDEVTMPALHARFAKSGEPRAPDLHSMPWLRSASESGAAAAGREPPLPGDLAYVIYTSGSTGRPKGVEVQHGSLSNLVQAMVCTFGTRIGDRASQVAGIGFDAAVMEIWHPLSAGATLHVAPAGLRRDPAALVRWFGEVKLTMAMVPTALVHMVVEEYPHMETGLRLLMTGGAALNRRPSLDMRFPLVNMYGPTECTVAVTAGVVNPAGVEETPPRLGRPLANCRIYILDERLEPVPVGRRGEIFIGGPQVARGYRGRPDLTAERFLPDPFVDGGVGAGGRMYRTGDIASFRADGEIEFHGRSDEQVEIRGHRIEPPEIEAALVRHAGVRSAFVRALPHRAGESKLAAYYTPVGEHEPTVAELRAHVSGRLPPYMVPGHYVELEALPLTAHGKVDGDRLPKPTAARPRLSSSFAPLASAGERRAAEVFSSVLGIPEIGADDDFFELGGDSLDAAARQLDDEFEMELIDPGPARQRIVPCVGDLARPLLGLGGERFEGLAASVGAIFHSGAQVQHLKGYEHHRAANVDGTREVIRLAMAAGAAPLHYVSSISTAFEMSRGRLVERADAGERPPEIGYAASKWVAERLCMEARKRGVPVSIVRLGRIMGSLATGATSDHDAAVLLVKGCIEARAFPDWNGWEPWMRVDLLAAELAASPFEVPPAGPVVYPAGAVARYREIFGWVADFGYEMEEMPLGKWRRRVSAAATANSAAPVLSSLGLEGADGGGHRDSAPQAGGIWRMEPVLPGSRGPALTREYVHAMLAYLVDRGFLPPATGSNF